MNPPATTVMNAIRKKSHVSSLLQSYAVIIACSLLLLTKGYLVVALMFTNLGNVQLLRHDDCSSAGRYFDLGIRWAPQSVVPYRAQGFLLLESQASQAIDVLSEAAHLSPEDKLTRVRLGWAYVQQDRLEEAAAIWARSGLLKLVTSLANEYRNRGNDDKALRIYRSIIGIDSTVDAVAYHELGIVYYYRKQYQEAKKSFEESLAVNPDSAWTWQLLGATLYQMGETQRAEELFEYGLSLGNEDIGLLIFPLRFYINNTSEYEKAITWAKRGQQRFPLDWRFDFDLGRAYLGAGLVGQAIDILTSALNKQPDEPAAVYYWLGLAYEQDGQFELAEEALAQAVRLLPSDQRISEALTRVRTRQ